jgi:hypothetical protein
MKIYEIKKMLTLGKGKIFILFEISFYDACRMLHLNFFPVWITYSNNISNGLSIFF